MDYFSDIRNGGETIVLRFPYFNLLFLVLYLMILSTQVICMLKHRYSTLCHYLSNISLHQTRAAIRNIRSHNRDCAVSSGKRLTRKLSIKGIADGLAGTIALGGVAAPTTVNKVCISVNNVDLVQTTGNFGN